MRTLEFLSQYSFNVLYALTLVLSVLKYPKYYDSILKYFPVLIAYTLMTEILGWYILKYEDFQIIYEKETHLYEINNAIIYNIFDIIFYLYFFHLYHQAVKSIRYKNFIKYGAFIFLIICLVNLFLQDFKLLPQLYAIFTGSLILTNCIVFYLLESVKNKEKVLRYNNVLLWISLGLLIFYPFYPFLIIVGINFNELYAHTFNLVHKILIAAMYLCFIIGFLRMKRFKSSV